MEIDWSRLNGSEAIRLKELLDKSGGNPDNLQEYEIKGLEELLDKAGFFGDEQYETLSKIDKELEEKKKAWSTHNPAKVEELIPPEDWLEKMFRGMETVGGKNWELGVSRPKADPIEAGIEAQATYEEQMRKDEVLKRREEGLKRTNMDEWFDACQTATGRRLVEGFKNRKKKIDKAIKGWHPVLRDHVAEVRALPAVTDADREERMLANLRGLKKRKGERR